MTLEQKTDEQEQFLTFHAAGEEFALSIMKVKEILRLEALTKVPSSPPAIRGVMNVRGSVVPVLDLAVRCGMPASAIQKRSCVVLVEVLVDGEPTVVGVLADSVEQVMELGAEGLEPPPRLGMRGKQEFLTGLARQGRRFALVIDIDRLLSAELLAAASAASGQEAQEDGELASSEGERSSRPT